MSKAKFQLIRSAVLACLVAAPLSLAAQQAPQGGDLLRQADQQTSQPGISPIRRIERDPVPLDEPFVAAGFRSIDGSGNNLDDPTIGSTEISLRRLAPADYADGISELAGADRPSPREISNLVVAEPDGLVANERGASDFLWQWGQFLDHDIDLTDGADPAEPANIAVPTGDMYFDPTGTGTAEIALNRSIYDEDSGFSVQNPRQQLNEITAWIDASNVYGSDETRALALRTLDGSGQLKTSDGNLLPFNTEGLANAGGSSDSLFLAGDVRANEQIGLTTMHTLFMREHNRQARRIASQFLGLSGDEIYERARRIVGAQMQVITYREFLPLLLGPEALAPYRGYQPDVDAGIVNMFSTAAYRFGHSALSPELQRLNANGEVIAAGNVSLADSFFSPSRITDEGGIAPILRGLASQQCQEIDPFLIDEVRNFLFGPPGAGGFDLASLNIQRGRDHGLPDYNSARIALGLAPVDGFADISSDPEIQDRLATAYGDVDSIDLWVGGLAEDHLPGAMVGELVFTVLKHQFEALRDGDRFWYQIALDDGMRREVERTKLADIIRRNTNIGAELPQDVFRVGLAEPQPRPGPGTRPPRR